jgi:death-on-curing protein
VTLADALSAHKRALAFGGLPGVKSWDLVESALGRPYCGYFRRVWEKAAVIVHGFVKNHGFNDGNKRTALILAYTFIARSGYDLVSSDPAGDPESELEELILAVEADMPLEEISEWFRARLHPRI